MDEPFTDYEGEQMLLASAKKCQERMDKCKYKYEDIDVKSGTLDVRQYCKLRKGKLCPNIKCKCWFSD